jgi:hypothetical protein
VEGEGYQYRLSIGDLLLVLLCHYGTDNTTWSMIDDGLLLPHSHVLNIVSKRCIQAIFFLGLGFEPTLGFGQFTFCIFTVRVIYCPCVSQLSYFACRCCVLQVTC